MPRKPRFYLPNVTAHIVQRGNNRNAAFINDSDYRKYLQFLSEASSKHNCAIHAYVLMTNHIHLLVTPTESSSISKLIQSLGRNYVTYFNRRYSRSGTLWEGRHKGAIIENERYAIACYRYIELNPVRAGMVAAPGEYPWSSYHANALGQEPRWIRPMEEYRNLGNTAVSRRQAYQSLFVQEWDSGSINKIRSSVQTGTPLGNKFFRNKVEKILCRTIGHYRRGRPACSSNAT